MSLRRDSRVGFVGEIMDGLGNIDGPNTIEWRQSSELSEDDIQDIINSPARFSAEEIEDINQKEIHRSFGPNG